MKIQKRKHIHKLEAGDFLYVAADPVYVSAWFIIAFEFNTIVAEERIRQAVSNTIRKFEKFRMTPSKIGLRYKMRTMLPDSEEYLSAEKDMFISFHNIEPGTSEYYKTLRDLINKKFKLFDHLPIKFFLLTGKDKCTLSVLTHHAASDGGGIMVMASEIIRQLNTKMTDIILKKFQPSWHSLAFNRPIQKIPLQFFQSITKFINTAKDKNIKPVIVSFKDAGLPKSQGFQTRNLTSPVEMTRSYAKSIKVSVTALVMYAIAINIREAMGNNSENAISVCMPINIRKLRGCDDDRIGVYTFTPKLVIPFDELNDKPEVSMRIINGKIRDEIESVKNGKLLFEYLVGKLIMLLGANFLRWFYTYLLKNDLVKFTTTLTNLGDLDYLNTNGSEVKVERVIFAPVSERICFSLTSNNNNLTLSVIYPENIHTDSDISDLLERIDSTITHITRRRRAIGDIVQNIKTKEAGVLKYKYFGEDRRKKTEAGVLKYKYFGEDRRKNTGLPNQVGQ